MGQRGQGFCIRDLAKSSETWQTLGESTKPSIDWKSSCVREVIGLGSRFQVIAASHVSMSRQNPPCHVAHPPQLTGLSRCCKQIDERSQTHWCSWLGFPKQIAMFSERKSGL